jgi:hypothetical protein
MSSRRAFWREGSYESRDQPRRVQEWRAGLRHRQFQADVRSVMG